MELIIRVTIQLPDFKLS